MTRRYLSLLGDVVHALQAERGCSTLYLGTAGTLFADRLENARRKTDDALAALNRENGGGAPTAPSPVERDVAAVTDGVARCLAGLRPDVDALHCSPAAGIAAYSHRMIAGALALMIDIARALGTPPASLSAYQTLLNWKERVGLERALGGRGLAQESFRNAEFIDRLVFLMSEQDSYRDTFLALAPHHLRENLEGKLAESASGELDRIHRAFGLSPERAIPEDMGPEAWFDLVSERLDMLHACEKAFEKMLDDSRDHDGAEQISGPIALSSITEAQQAFLKTLPLFSALPEAVFADLLRHAVVRTLPKGKLMFIEGEQAHHLYVILEGWLKVFKASVEGEETVLQMLGSGDAVMEAAVFLDTPFPASAQAAETVCILSLPAPILRERVRTSNELALNVLTSMSHRSQLMIRQIEYSRVQSVDERLRTFLLALLVDQGRISRCIKLPYDKSLIASYLNMKRETLSRALGRLKEEGYRVENDTVVVPRLASLCRACDPAIALSCPARSHQTCGKAAVPEFQPGGKPAGRALQTEM